MYLVNFFTSSIKFQRLWYQLPFRTAFYFLFFHYLRWIMRLNRAVVHHTRWKSFEIDQSWTVF